jgi:hypothetical protein
MYLAGVQSTGGGVVLPRQLSKSLLEWKLLDNLPNLHFGEGLTI